MEYGGRHVISHDHKKKLSLWMGPGIKKKLAVKRLKTCPIQQEKPCIFINAKGWSNFCFAEQKLIIKKGAGFCDAEQQKIYSSIFHDVMSHFKWLIGEWRLLKWFALSTVIFICVCRCWWSAFSLWGCRFFSGTIKGGSWVGQTRECHKDKKL